MSPDNILITIIALLYLLPAAIAVCRGHRNAVAIVLLDVLLGWTFIGWVGALIWSVANGPDPRNPKGYRTVSQSY